MATLDDVRIAQAIEAHGFLAAAEGMLMGAQHLVKVEPIPAYALTLLCGHACETALKAILSRNCISERVLSRKPYGHNLKNLWEFAANEGFAISLPYPDWLGQLDRVYGGQYRLRYPLGFHGIVLPNQASMFNGVESLVCLARGLVK